ncbi:MAG: PAS domain S-box protein, partial [Acidobacteriaceae bacterium]|nr:PAS domain S-box protein [Acidobacteriaceae bacterium]
MIAADGNALTDLLAGTRKKARILLVGDDADLREHVARILGENYELVISESGQLALELIQQHPPDLLLADLMMPMLDGFELLRAVRADGAGQTLPVIFISPPAGEEMRVEDLEAAADDYLVKPFTANELRERVGTHLRMAVNRRRAEEERAALLLREREAREEAERLNAAFRQMLDALPAAIYTTDAEGRLTHFNPAAVKLSGRVPELGTDQWCVTWKLFHPDGTPLPHDQCPMATALRDGEAPQGAECIAERPDGTRFWFTPYPTILRDDKGRLIGGINMLVDITERKRAENLTLLLGAIVDSSDDAIVSKDLNGIVTSWNKGAERLFGYSADEVIGKSITIIIPPDRLSEEPEILSRLQRGERVDHFETIRRRKDGSLLNISLTISPVKDGRGRIIGASKIARDITERKRAEAALLESEGRFRQLADSMPQIVWTARPDGFVDYYNERWFGFTGFDRNNFGDVSWEPILHPDDVKRCKESWQASVSTGRPYEIEYRFWDRTENRWRWFMGRALAVTNEGGKIAKWFGTCTDIDDQKRVQEELRCANQDLEQFAFSASHDLQEPLRGVEIYSELLAKRYSDKLDGQALQFLHYLRGSALRMEMLVRDLLAYTQVTKLEAPECSADANDALTDTLASLEGAIVESGARVTSDPLPCVRVHGIHLRQLLQNLVGNAIKYRSPERVSTVHVSA